MSIHTKQPTQIDTNRFVRAILESNRRPDAQLEDLVIGYTCHDSIGRVDPSDELILGAGGSRLVIMDRVSVDREWRGQRFGPFLAGRALRHLSGDQAIAVCYPSPFELLIDHPDHDRERARLGRIWEHLVFRHYRDGVFVCDPTAGELDSALNELTKVVLG